jgi:hypothetical protein
VNACARMTCTNIGLHVVTMAAQSCKFADHVAADADAQHGRPASFQVSRHLHACRELLAGDGPQKIDLGPLSISLIYE